MAIKTLSTKIKKLTALVLSTLAVLTFSSSSLALNLSTDAQVTASYQMGRNGNRAQIATNEWVGGCDTTQSFYGYPNQIQNVMFYNNDNCTQHITFIKDDFVTYNFQVVTTTPDVNPEQSPFTTLWQLRPINPVVDEFDIVDVDVDYGNNTYNASVTLHYKGDGSWAGFTGAFVQYADANNLRVFLNWQSITVYRLLPQQSTTNTETNAQQQLEGQDNIKNQDTSGKEQGTGGQEQSLLDVLNGFITAITGAQATNCNLAMDLGVVDMGTVNLCSLEPPTWITVVGSIVIIAIFVPLSMAILNRILTLIREMQT